MGTYKRRRTYILSLIKRTVYVTQVFFISDRFHKGCVRTLRDVLRRQQNNIRVRGTALSRIQRRRLRARSKQWKADIRSLFSPFKIVLYGKSHAGGTLKSSDAYRRPVGLQAQVSLI